MNLNEMLNKKLSSEEKIKFQRENGKFKVLQNLVIIPILTALIGIYFENVIVVSVSAIGVMVFLGISIYGINSKGTVYSSVIIPYVLKEKFSDVYLDSSNASMLEKYDDSKLSDDYDKIQISNYFRIDEGRYNIEVSKVTTQKLQIEESDGVKDKHYEVNFSGIFAVVNLPNNFDNDFRAVENKKDIKKIMTIDASNTELVRMNYIDFDKLYDVYSMTPITTKKMLSVGVMARIIDLNEKIGKVINFSVYKNVLYVKINYPEFLEFKSKDSKKYVDEKIAEENLKVLEILEYFIRYIININ